MLYLIGGPPRMGKSALAQKLLDHQNIPGVSTDGLTVMLGTEGIPEFYSQTKAERFYPYFKLFIERTMQAEPHYAIEGDAFMPRHAAEIALKYPTRCVFLGMSHVTPDTIVKYQHYDKWASQNSRDELQNLAGRIMRISQEIRAECIQHKLPYVDLSGHYRTNFTTAYRHLV